MRKTWTKSRVSTTNTFYKSANYKYIINRSSMKCFLIVFFLEFLLKPQFVFYVVHILSIHLNLNILRNARISFFFKENVWCWFCIQDWIYQFKRALEIKSRVEFAILEAMSTPFRCSTPYHFANIFIHVE